MRRGRTSRPRATSLPPTGSRCGSAPRRPADGDAAEPRALPPRVVLRRQAARRREARGAARRRADARHRADLDQLHEVAERLGAEVITGETSKERQRLYDAFRTGEITTLVVSKVANFSSTCQTTSRSRSADSARVRRRPSAWLVSCGPGDGRNRGSYTIVSRDTVDADFAAHRQRFLAEQGYAYRSSTPTTSEPFRADPSDSQQTPSERADTVGCGHPDSTGRRGPPASRTSRTFVSCSRRRCASACFEVETAADGTSASPWRQESEPDLHRARRHAS